MIGPGFAAAAAARMMAPILIALGLIGIGLFLFGFFLARILT